MGIDRFELRRRNHVRPQQIPYKAASGMTYDSGDFGAIFEKAVKEADVSGFPERKKQSKATGKLRGLGLGSYLEVTAPPNKEMGAIRFEADGAITLISGTLDYGQGHAAPFAQVLASRLGVPFDRIRLVQSDSDQLVFGAGTGGSRSAMMGGGAIAQAADLVIKKGKELAGEVLETAAGDIEFRDGRFTVAGTDRTISILELVKRKPGALDVTHVTEVIPSAFPNGCHVAEVEIDPDTGDVTLARYTAVDDCGRVFQPVLVEGQVQGGVAQGVGQALLESGIYDPASGQLLAGSFMDYAMPRAADLPDIVSALRPVPATSNPLGVKGVGEAGTTASLAAVMNAVADALPEAPDIDMPATPDRVWRAIHRR